MQFKIYVSIILLIGFFLLFLISENFTKAISNTENKIKTRLFVEKRIIKMNEEQLPEIGKRLDIIAYELFNNLEKDDWKEVNLEIWYEKGHYATSASYVNLQNKEISISAGLDELDMFKLLKELHSITTDNSNENYWNKISLKLTKDDNGQVNYNNNFIWDEDFAKD